MLELGRYPACVLPCHTTLTEVPAQRSMSDRKHSGSSRDAAKTERRERSKPMRDHRHGRSSAEDPTISSTRSSKSVSTNARNHPRAELRDSDAPRQIEAGSGGRQSQGSPAANHVSSSKSNGGRKRVCEVLCIILFTTKTFAENHDFCGYFIFTESCNARTTFLCAVC
jgi:hypothetical protein